MEIRPISIKDANAFVFSFHRHNTQTGGGKFAIACYEGERICGVAICCRPVARRLDDGMTLEISRNCTDGTRNACSKLYGACVRIAKDMGYKKVITYILQSENGASVKASNFTLADANCGGTTWDMPGRRRNAQLSLFPDDRKYPNEKKQRWEIQL